VRKCLLQNLHLNLGLNELLNEKVESIKRTLKLVIIIVVIMLCYYSYYNYSLLLFINIILLRPHVSIQRFNAVCFARSPNRQSASGI